MINVLKPSYSKREQDAVARVLAAGWTGLGPETEAFEKEFALYKNTTHAIGTNSCTAALVILMKAMGIGPGDTVIVPALTFISTAHAVKQCGATPIFCDIDRETLMIDWQGISVGLGKLYPKPKAIIAVNYAGTVPKSLPGHFCGIPVIHDCAHAVATHVIYEKPIYCCWSFHAVKNLSCGDGGMITTSNDEIAKKCRTLRWMGIDKSTWDRIESGGVSPDVFAQKYSWEYEVNDFGIKGHMNDIQAAIGRVQLKRLETMQLIRKAVASRYHIGLRDIPDLELPLIEEGHGLHLYVVRTDRRDELSSFLKSKGIQTGVHYKPVHLHKCYYYNEHTHTKLPVVEKEWKRLLSLPLHACLTHEEIEHVIYSVKEFFERSQK